MSQPPDATEPAGEGQVPTPPTQPTTKRQSRRKGIQFDGFKIKPFEFGIKADVRPAEIGEPIPRDAKEVAFGIKAHLRAIAVNLFGLVSDGLVAMRKYVRGAAEIPPADAKRVEKAHDLGDRKEGRKQEALESGRASRPDVAKTVDRLEALLAELRAEGTSVDLLSLKNGAEAIIIARPGVAEDAARLAQAAFPSSLPTTSTESISPLVFLNASYAGPIDTEEPLPSLLPPSSTTSGAVSLPLDVLLPSGAARALASAGVLSLAGLTAWSAEELVSLDGFGKKSLVKVRVTLARFGLKLKEE